MVVDVAPAYNDGLDLLMMTDELEEDCEEDVDAEGAAYLGEIWSGTFFCRKKNFVEKNFFFEFFFRTDSFSLPFSPKEDLNIHQPAYTDDLHYIQSDYQEEIQPENLEEDCEDDYMQGNIDADLAYYAPPEEIIEPSVEMAEIVESEDCYDDNVDMGEGAGNTLDSLDGVLEIDEEEYGDYGGLDFGEIDVLENAELAMVPNDEILMMEHDELVEEDCEEDY